jgi:hypothetical protein
MLPADPRGGSRRHLNWIVRVVWLLRQSRPVSSRDA